MYETPYPQQNHILDALPVPEPERLFPHLTPVELPLGAVLYESGDALRHIYFPIDSIISLLYVLQDGAPAEIAVVGNDGAIGVALFMGGETTTSRAIVQSAGFAFKLSRKRLKEELGHHGQMLKTILLRVRWKRHEVAIDRHLRRIEELKSKLKKLGEEQIAGIIFRRRPSHGNRGL